MPLNINGNIVNASIADTLDTEGIVKRGLALYLDSDSLDSYPGNDIVYDISTNANTGSMYNGSAVSFDGSNDYIVGGTGDNGFTSVSSTYSISFWIKWNNMVTTDGSGYLPHEDIIGFNQGTSRGWRILYSEKGSASSERGWSLYGTGDNDTQGTHDSVVNVWYHMVLTCGGSNDCEFYRDGESLYTFTNTTKPSGSLVISGDSRANPPNSYFFDGSLSDVRIYDTELSANQVSEFYRSPNTVLPAGVSASALVGWWPLTEGNGTTAYDGSGNENHGTLTNGPSWVGGQTDIPQLAGKGHSTKMVYDGIDDAVSISADPAIDGYGKTSITWSSWIWAKTYGEANAARIIRKDSSYQIEIKSSYTFEVNVYHTSTSARAINDTAISTKRWYHLGVVYNDDGNKKIKIYIDGILQGLGTDTAGSGTISDDSADTLVIGNVPALSRTWDGLIDEVAIWGVALDAAAVLAIYNSGVPIDLRNNLGNYDGYTNNLNGYWRNDGVGTWKDLSGQENDGTVAGSPAQVSFPKGTTSKRDSQGFPSGPGSFQFNGDNDYISLGGTTVAASDRPLNAYPFTFTAWVTSDTGWSPASGMDELLNMKIGSQRVSLGAVTSPGWVTGPTIMYGGSAHWSCAASAFGNPTGWTHIAYVIYGSNNSSHKIYINGVSQTMTNNGGSHGGTAGWTLGNNSVNSESWFGNIGLISLYSRILTQEEVSHNFNVQRDRFGV